MSPELWKEIELVFEDASEVPLAERAVFLANRCGDRPELLREVEKLLRNDELAGAFMESPIWTDGFLDSSVKNVFSSPLIEGRELDTDLTGSIIGPYRLVSEIGRGGMGTVYLGERVDGEFSQEVAIKLLKRGLDSEFIVKRFRHERQILASFEHPFISRLLDGGTTPDGVPYFVMEYIRGGVNIYDWCDERGLDIAARLRLFLKVCSALEYAHERKVVHRDIKPGNILVNRSGAPKLLDFGIAKILDPDLIHESFYPTAALIRMMTPDYASPEQIRGGEITHASDIYSLGVLLYELISGHRPYKLELPGINELSTIICEVDPDPPSESLSNESTRLKRYSSSVTLAESRAATVASLAETLRALDPIVLRALEKEPEDRFVGVGELSDELGRFTDPSAFDKTRHGVSIAVGDSSHQRSLAVLPFRTIIFNPSADSTDDQFIGVGLADALTARLSRIHKFLVLPSSSVVGFRDGTTDPIRAGRRLKVDHILDGSIKISSERLRLSVQLLDVKSNAAVWATSIDQTVDDFSALERALSNQLLEALVPRISSGEMANYSRRGTDSHEAFECYLRGRYHFSLMTEEHLAKAFVFFHQAIAADPDYAHPYCGIANYYNWLGVIGVLSPKECFPPALEAAEKAVELDPDLSEAHASLGFSLHVGKFDWDAAEKHFKRSIELNPNNANAYLWYSTFLFMAGSFEKGFEYARRATVLDPLTPYSHYNIGSGLYYARRFAEAEAQHQKVVDEFPDYGLGYYGLGKLHRYLGKTKLAIEDNERAAALLDGSTLVQISTAESLAADGKHDEALAKLEELKDLSKKRFVSPYMLAMVYSFLGDNEKVLDLLEESLAAREAWLCCAPVEARFENVFEHPRFKAVLKGVNHPTAPKTPVHTDHGEKTRTFSDRTTILLDEAI